MENVVKRGLLQLINIDKIYIMIMSLLINIVHNANRLNISKINNVIIEIITIKRQDL